MPYSRHALCSSHLIPSRLHPEAGATLLLLQVRGPRRGEAPLAEAQAGLRPRAGLHALGRTSGSSLLRSSVSPGAVTCPEASGSQWADRDGHPLLALSSPWVGVKRNVPQGPRGRAFYSGLPEVGREGPRTGVWGLTIRSFLSVCGGRGQQRCLHTRVSRTAPRSPNTVCPDGGGGPGSGAQGARGCGRGAPALLHQPGFKAGIAVPCKP